MPGSSATRKFVARDLKFEEQAIGINSDQVSLLDQGNIPSFIGFG